MIVKKLTNAEKKNMDLVAWVHTVLYSERESIYTTYMNGNIQEIIEGLRNVKSIDYYLIKDNNVEIGRFIIRRRDTELVNTVNNILIGLIIYPEYRNKGYARKVLNAIINKHMTEDSKTQYLTLDTSNYMFSVLLEKMGFVDIGRQASIGSGHIEIKYCYTKLGYRMS